MVRPPFLTALAGLVLAGCSAQSLKEGLGSLGSIASPAPASTPSTPPAPAPTPRPVAANGTEKAPVALNAQQTRALNASGRASVEVDGRCSELVKPFDLTGNLTGLTQVGLEALGVDAAQWLEDQAKGRRPTTRSRSARSKQGVPQRVQQEARRMNWLPMEVEVLYGDRQVESMRHQLVARGSRVDRDKGLYARADAIVAELQTGIQAAHPYRWQVHVAKADERNAVALPGGHLVLDAGLLDPARSHDKAYFAVAHEISHVLQRHETRALQARVIDAVWLGGKFEEFLQRLPRAQSEPQLIVGLLGAGKLMFEKHTEVQELQSDACAMRVLDAAVKPPRMVAAAQAFVSDMAPDKPRPANSTEVVVEIVTRPIDSHPRSAERIQNLNTMIRELAKGDTSTVPPRRR